MKDKIKNIPESPGVYKFFSNKELIYIGKAKNLKKGLHPILESLLRIEKQTKYEDLPIILKFL